jgi:hypothetical protein
MGNFIFSLCGVAVGLTCQEPHQSELIRDLWDRLYNLGSGNLLTPDVQYLFEIPRQVIEPHSGDDVVISESAHLTVLRKRSGYFLRSRSSTLDVDVENGKCTGVLNEGFWQQSLEYQREYFLLSFQILLRPKGRFSLHANVIVNDEAGYIIVGPAGSGKTTLMLSMVRVGWRFLSDDANMLQDTPHGIFAHALRRGLSCTSGTLAHYPELKSSAEEAPELSEGKKLIDIETQFPQSFTPRCMPKVLLFPEITTARSSQLFPLDDTQAMIALVRQSPGIMSDQPWVVKQMGVLKALLQQTRPYRLSLGSDIFDSPETVSDKLYSVIRV